MSSINFDNVYLLFIAIPLLALICVPFFITIRKDNRNGHNIASFALHVLMAVLISFSLAGTQIVTVITKTEVYVVADVSYSAEKNLDSVDGYISQLSNNLPKRSKLGVVCFGKNYKLVTPLGKNIRTVKSSGVDDTETNIVEALEYTGELFSDGVIKHIVLITDGRQTYNKDSAALTRAVNTLQARNIHVDAIYLDDNIADSDLEMQISGVEFKDNVYMNHNEQATVRIDSSVATSASTDSKYKGAFVTVYKNGEQLGDARYRDLSKGVNTVSVDLDTSEAGTFDYRIEITSDWDDNKRNNTFSFTQTVSADINVLLITSDRDEADYIKELYTEQTSVTTLLAENKIALPTTVEELCKYDEIILSDVDLSEHDNYESFLKNLDTAVSMFGKSLITFGDVAIQSKPTGELKQLDDMLPVRYGESDSDKKLYTIVFDISHSMQVWSRFALAKKAAAQLINFLPDNDSVCIVAFSGQPRMIQPVTSLQNRDKVLEKIENLTFEQGTIMSAGLNSAYSAIKNRNDFSQKQVMLITDGIPYDNITEQGLTDREYSQQIVEEMRAYKIYTSVLNVGGGNQDYREWMSQLARIGGGKHYIAENETQLGAVLFSDINEDVNKSVIEENSFITTELKSDVIVTGDETQNLTEMDFENVYVSKFVVSKKKSSGVQNVLTVEYKSGNVYVSVPLYAYWNYGNGKVKSYTGLINGMNKLGGGSTEANRGFFTNVINSSLPEEKVSQSYLVTQSVDGKTATVQLDTAELRRNASATLTLTTPSGETVTDSFILDLTNYYYKFDMPETGKYSMLIEYSYGGNVYATQSSVTLSYEPEYDKFAVFEASVLYKALGGSGTVSEDGNLTLTQDESEVETFTLKLQLPFLIAGVVLFVADIVIRKIRWNDITSLFRKLKRMVRGEK